MSPFRPVFSAPGAPWPSSAAAFVSILPCHCEPRPGPASSVSARGRAGVCKEPSQAVQSKPETNPTRDPRLRRRLLIPKSIAFPSPRSKAPIHRENSHGPRGRREQRPGLAVKPCWCYSTLWRATVRAQLDPFPRALNSAVECHLHTVEVVGSNPTAPTIEINKPNAAVVDHPFVLSHTSLRRAASREAPRQAGAGTRLGPPVKCPFPK